MTTAKSLFNQLSAIVGTTCEVVVLFSLWSQKLVIFVYIGCRVGMGDIICPITNCYGGEFIMGNNELEYASGNIGTISVNISRMSYIDLAWDIQQ